MRAKTIVTVGLSVFMALFCLRSVGVKPVSWSVLIPSGALLVIAYGICVLAERNARK
jgi:hypothetical protein